MFYNNLKSTHLIHLKRSCWPLLTDAKYFFSFTRSISSIPPGLGLDKKLKEPTIFISDPPSPIFYIQNSCWVPCETM